MVLYCFNAILNGKVFNLNAKIHIIIETSQQYGAYLSKKL